MWEALAGWQNQFRMQWGRLVRAPLPWWAREEFDPAKASRGPEAVQTSGKK